MRSTVILPRIAPRNFIDGMISVIHSVLFIATLFAISCAAIFCLIFLQAWIYTEASFLWKDVLSFASMICLILILTMSLFTVSSITMTAEGIHFHRLAGFPKFMPWSRIKFVSLASRRELIVQGWLCPPFLPRDVTMSLSSLKHYRIQWDTGFCYYPPLEPKVFEQCVKEYLQTESEGRSIG